MNKHFVYKCKKLLISYSSLFLAFLSVCLAQQEYSSTNVDSLFEKAREKAFAGQRDSARMLCRIILERSPNYLDAGVLLARTFGWDGQYDSARIELAKILQLKPDYKDAINALIDTELWANQPDQAMMAADAGLKYYPNEEDFLFKKARALAKQGREEEALIILFQLEKINPSHQGMISLRSEIKLQNLLYQVAMTYTYDYYSKVHNPMHLASLQFSRLTTFGSVFGRINFGNRFDKNGLQYELESYPGILSGIYGYVNYGYSTASIFPRHRGGLEIFSKLPYSSEGSLGLRYLYFGSGTDVIIYTSSIGIYYGNYWTSLRIYLNPKSIGMSRSANVTTRRYLSEPDSYLFLRLGIGVAPDERISETTAGVQGKEVFDLHSQSGSVGWQQTISATYQLLAIFDIIRQERTFPRNDYLYIYSLSVGFKKRF